jgi:FkbM family methyltransferase
MARGYKRSRASFSGCVKIIPYMNSTRFYTAIQRMLSPLKGKGFRKYAAVRFVLSYMRPVSAQINGFTMKLDRTDETISRMILAGDFESFETGIIKNIVKTGFSVLDIGANIGYYSLVCAELVGPEGKVYAFEPTPRTFEILKCNIHNNGFDAIVAPYQYGVSNVNQKAQLYINDYNKGDNRLYKSADMKSIDIDLVTIDSFLKPSGKIDVIKMDIQGAEALAVKGMSQLLQKDKPIIVMEFWPHRIKRLGIEPKEMLQDLVTIGYSFQDIEEHNKKIVSITAEDLLKKYPDETELATNIICTIN